MKQIKGYKVFNHDWTCRGFQYKSGETYSEDVDLELCERGFHFCEKLSDCFSYYTFNSENKVAEVVAIGEIVRGNNKCCTNKIKIGKELTWSKVLEMVNEEKGCTGLCNTGDRNTGNGNTGNSNTGNCNTGDWNTGDWNNGDRNTGCFMTEEQNIMLFDKASDMTYIEWFNSAACDLLSTIPKRVVEWIDSEDMTDTEKKNNPTHDCTGGYLKVLDESECAQMWWDGLNSKEKNIVRSIPNFDPNIFKKCTGITV